MRVLLAFGVAILTAACGSPLAPPPVVCTVEYHAFASVVRPVRGGYILVDEGPLTPVTVCR